MYYLAIPDQCGQNTGFHTGMFFRRETTYLYKHLRDFIMAVKSILALKSGGFVCRWRFRTTANLCHAYMALGGCQLAIQVELRKPFTRYELVVYPLPLNNLFYALAGCKKDINSEINQCNILEPFYSKTLQVWKRLTVESFEKLNVNLYINQLVEQQKHPHSLKSCKSPSSALLLRYKLVTSFTSTY